MLKGLFQTRIVGKAYQQHHSACHAPQRGSRRAVVVTAMQPNSHYAVLGVACDATQHEIKRAFRQKSKTIHPDVCKQLDSHEQFIQCRTAYDTLSCGQARAAYDDSLSFSALSSLSPTPMGPRASESGCIICEDEDDYECYADGGACAGAYSQQYGGASASFFRAAASAPSPTPSSQPSSNSYGSSRSSYSSGGGASSHSSSSDFGSSSSYSSGHSTSSGPTRSPYRSSTSSAYSSSDFGSSTTGYSSTPSTPPRVRPSQAVIDPDLRDTMAALIKEARHWSRKVERNWVNNPSTMPSPAAAGFSNNTRSASARPVQARPVTPTHASYTRQTAVVTTTQRASAARPGTVSRLSSTRPSSPSKPSSSTSSDGDALPWVYYNPATAAAASGRASISTQAPPPRRF